LAVAPQDRDNHDPYARGAAAPDHPLRDDSPAAEDADELATRAAERLVAQAEYGDRERNLWLHAAICVIAAAWSLFQLSLPKLLMLSSDYVRAIHLTFAVTLTFLSFPALKRPRRWRWLRPAYRFLRRPWLDIPLALAAGFCAAYYALDYAGIAARQGLPLTRDLVVGVALIVLLLEAARRALGPALPIVATAFLAWALLADRAPEVMAFRPVSARRLIGQMTLGQEGIYGVPLRVSAQTVFLFVLLGAMLEKTGGGRFFVQLAYSLMGRFRGGPAKAAVLSSGLTGMVTGSSIANVVTTGTFTIPLMKKSGYPPDRAAAIEVAASTNGQLMPPIMGAAAFIIAENCRMGYLEVIRAAFIPAIVSYVALIYITHLEAGKLGLKGLPASELPRFLHTLARGAHFLLPLAALLWMLLRGFSPEMAAFYAILTLAALVVVRSLWTARRHGRTLAGGLRHAGAILADSLVAGGRGMMTVAVACAAAGIIVGVVGLGPGAKITGIVEALAGENIVLVLIFTAMASLLLGMGLPTTANYIVMASITAPVIVNLAAKVGFEVPLIGAHLFCFFFGILADDTPPVGLAAYAGAAIAGCNPIKAGLRGFLYDMRTAILPFIFVFNTDLLLWNIHAWWRIGVVFAASMLAMFAFAALTQRYMVVPNRLHESLLLGLSALMLLRPRLPAELLERWSQVQAPGPLDSKFFWYAAGLVPMAAVFVLQRRRKRRAAA
jgi:TRAP transporter 4TM/12TM fusion protein